MQRLELKLPASRKRVPGLQAALKQSKAGLKRRYPTRIFMSSFMICKYPEVSPCICLLATPSSNVSSAFLLMKMLLRDGYESSRATCCLNFLSGNVRKRIWRLCRMCQLLTQQMCISTATYSSPPSSKDPYRPFSLALNDLFFPEPMWCLETRQDLINFNRPCMNTPECDECFAVAGSGKR